MSEVVDRHEIDCVCGKTTTGEGQYHAEVLHLIHFLNDHDDLEEWEEETAKEQLEHAKSQREEKS